MKFYKMILSTTFFFLKNLVWQLAVELESPDDVGPVHPIPAVRGVDSLQLKTTEMAFHKPKILGNYIALPSLL